MGINKKILAVALVAICAACGGGNGSSGGNGSATVSGTIGGQSMTAQDAISAVLGAGTPQSLAFIFITNSANQCSRITAHQAVRNGQALGLEIGTQSGTTITAPGPGTYPISTVAGTGGVSGPLAVAAYVATDATCTPTTTVPLEGASGNVVLTSVSDSGYVGTFDVTFSNNEHVTGSFNTATCTALAALSPATSCP
jgi:hypothetical protein